LALGNWSFGIGEPVRCGVPSVVATGEPEGSFIQVQAFLPHSLHPSAFKNEIKLNSIAF
jgi:hypothetical protein